MLVFLLLFCSSSFFLQLDGLERLGGGGRGFKMLEYESSGYPVALRESWFACESIYLLVCLFTIYIYISSNFKCPVSAFLGTINFS